VKVITTLLPALEALDRCFALAYGKAGNGNGNRNGNGKLKWKLLHGSV